MGRLDGDYYNEQMSAFDAQIVSSNVRHTDPEYRGKVERIIKYYNDDDDDDNDDVEKDKEDGDEDGDGKGNEINAINERISDLTDLIVSHQQSANAKKNKKVAFAL